MNQKHTKYFRNETVDMKYLLALLLAILIILMVGCQVYSDTSHIEIYTTECEKDALPNISEVTEELLIETSEDSENERNYYLYHLQHMISLINRRNAINIGDYIFLPFNKCIWVIDSSRQIIYKIESYNSRYLQNWNNALYFVDMLSDKDNEWSLIRIEMSDFSKTIILNGFAGAISNLMISDEYIVYSYFYTPYGAWWNHTYYSINVLVPDDSEHQLVFLRENGHVTFYHHQYHRGYIYYSLGGGTLFRMTLDGTEDIYISRLGAVGSENSNFMIYGDYIFFTYVVWNVETFLPERYLHRMNLDGTEHKRVIEEEILFDFFHVYNNSIYYFLNSNMHRASLDGQNIVLISDKIGLNYIAIAGDYVFAVRYPYGSRENGFELLMIRTDGSMDYSIIAIG